MSDDKNQQDVNSGEQASEGLVANELHTVEQEVLLTIQEDPDGTKPQDWWFHARDLNELSASAVKKLHRIENAYAPGTLAATRRLLAHPMGDEDMHFRSWSRSGTLAGIRGTPVPFSDRSDLPQTPFGLGCLLTCMDGYLCGLSLRADRVTNMLLTLLGPDKFTQLAQDCVTTRRPKSTSKYGRKRKAAEGSEGAADGGRSVAVPETTTGGESRPQEPAGQTPMVL